MGPKAGESGPHCQFILVRRAFGWADLKPLVGELGWPWAPLGDLNQPRPGFWPQKEEHRHIPKQAAAAAASRGTTTLGGVLRLLAANS